jgi:hypothetical protein
VDELRARGIEADESTLSTDAARPASAATLKPPV